jgi:transposase InsO family protein
MSAVHPIALFRLSVLGPLASREQFEHGELKRLLTELAAQTYFTPGERRVRLTQKTIERWYYAWKAGGIDALVPKPRKDRGVSKLSPEHQAAIVEAKHANPKRSLNSLRRVLELQGKVSRNDVSRSAIHRLLQHHGLSRIAGSASEPTEHRRFVAEFAGDLWQGDVMHGPSVPVKGRLRKVYLVSLMDDASRLIVHSAFCTGETALDIEGVLKQAVLKRGLPKKLLIDNGAAYRAGSLQGICARLEIRLIYCRPYQPQGKGKLEKWHRTVREQFLSELDVRCLRDLDDLNARLWAWLDQIYHQTVHTSLEGLTPLQRYQRDLVRIRPLGAFATALDALFYHRHPRTVRKDGTVSFQGRFFEVPFELNGQRVWLVVDPHREVPIAVESEANQPLGAVVALDEKANAYRKRHRPQPTTTEPTPQTGPNAVELALKQQEAAYRLPAITQEKA